MSGSRAVWPEVLAVYAVKTTTDPNNPQDVATMDASKKAILKDIFWQMNTISSRTETKTEEIITETDDGHGNIVETKTTVTRTYLYISVAHKTAGEMADKFGFNADQRKQLAELLAEENRSMWSAVLYGIYTEDGQIVSWLAMWAVSRIGVGMALTAVWNGAPVLFRGRRMSAGILIVVLSRNLQAAQTACNGLRIEVNGLTTAPRRRRV